MELRTSGINLIGNVPWGTHFCQFYETKEDLIDILIPYFKAGLENNEFCMLITSDPLSAEEAQNSLQKAVPDLDSYLEAGQIEILPYTEWYKLGGSFDSDRVLNGWIEKLNKALENGYDGLRLTGNTFWLEKEDWDDFVDYEAAVDNVIGKYKMMALCTYCLERCNAAEVIDVVNNHEFALIKRKEKWELIETTEHKRTEQELLDAMKKLQKSNSDLEQFAYVASHDLQEPLRMVSSFLQLLQRRYEGQLDTDADEFIEYAVDGAKRMHNLINDLLEFSRITSKGKEFEYVNMQEPLENALSNLKLVMEENNVNVVPDDMLPTINCDYSQMTILFQNLIGNAIKYRTEETPYIQISATNDDNNWLFSIKDNGLGIDPKQSDNIFKIFRRLHSNEEYKGAIGLAITKRIIERHEGNIWVDSKPGKGSTFYFTLPNNNY